MNETTEFWLKRLTATCPVQNEALEALRNILIGRLRKTFPGRTGVDESLLEDVTQVALIKTLDKLHQFQRKSRFTTWATTIAVRVAFTELRRRHWKDVALEQMLEDTPRGDGHTVDASTRLDPGIEQRALIEEMYRIIDTELTEKQRTALRAELKGMPLEEIGRRMGSNRNAIYKFTHDARKRLGIPPAIYKRPKASTMALSRRQIDALIRTVSLTRSDEVTCDECLKDLAEFVEQSLEGKLIPESLQAIEHHLAICAACQEEYQALLTALRQEE